MKLYFIGGASGSGKTAIMPELQKILGSEIKVYDFDDIGVPEGADKKWRQESTEKWLQQLLSDGKDACLLGQIVLGEIIACPSAKKLDYINFCLLDVSDFERIQRLKKRNTYGADQNMLNWSAWLRMHTRDPQWTQQVIKDASWDGLDFSSWDRSLTWPTNVSTKIIDTTSLDIKEVAEKVAAWINNNKIDTARLTIREITANDLNALYGLLSNEDVMRYSVHGPYSKKQTEDWISFITEHYKKYPLGMWAVIEKDNDVLIGICGLMPLSDDDSKYEIGYRILPDFQGKGYATEAAIAVRDYAISVGVNQFIAYIEKENKPSVKISEKIGMNFLKNGTYKNIPVLIYEYKVE